MPDPATTAVRGPLKYEIETSSPMVEAGRPFTVYLRITNPYEVPVEITEVRFPLPIEFVDVTFDERRDDRLRLFDREPPPVVQDGTTRNPFGPHVALARTTAAQNRRPTGNAGSGEAASPAEDAAWRLSMAQVQIQPGNTVAQNITLCSRRWVLFSPAAYHLEAQLAYMIDGRLNRESVKVPLTVKAPMMALIAGAALGAAAGGLLRYLFKVPDFSWKSLGPALVAMLANVVLSGVVIVAFGRKKDAQPFISIEDFWGALFIGFLVGTSGEEWLKFLTAGTPGGGEGGAGPPASAASSASAP